MASASLLRGCVAAAALLATFQAAEGAKRLTVNGSHLLDPDGNVFVPRGFDWYLPYVATTGNSAPGQDDGSLQWKYVPGATTVRLVGVFWDNSQDSNTDCRTDDASNGFIKPECIHQLDSAIKTATAQGRWVIITGRAEYAAGQDPANYPDVFTNATLRSQYYAMWTFLANHFKDIDLIAAYEIMSEPRVKTTPDSVVAGFMEGGCKAVQAVDPATPCMVGPAPYYKPWKLSSTYKLDLLNIIYTADFFIPANFVGESIYDPPAPYKWGSTYPCSEVFAGWVDTLCGGDSSKQITMNKALLELVLTNYVAKFRDQFNVPVIVNQFGAKRAVGSDNGRLEYMEDVLAAFNDAGVGALYWNWHWHGKETGDHWGGFEIIHDWHNGTRSVDNATIQLFDAAWKL